MTRPLRIQSETSPKSLKEMSNTELDYAAYNLLVAFAANSSGVGTLSVNPGTPGSLTLIGTFTDTYRPYNVGDHPVGTEITSEYYNVYQDLTTDNTAVSKYPVQYTPGQGVTTQSNTDMTGYIVDLAAKKLAADGLGSYKLQNTAPIVGGTWTSVATITDKASGGNSTTYLWRRTTQTTPTTYRPLKQELINNQYSLKEMSDAELQGLVPVLRNYIVSSGIGQYKLQTSAPVGGTWVTAGNSFSDTREQLGNVSYTGSYSGSYVPSYTGAYTGVYSGASFTGTYSQTFTGTYSRAFTGTYSRAFAGAYTGTYIYYYPYSGIIGGYYSGTYTGYYTGSFTGSYTGAFTGAYTGSFSGSYVPSYTGTYSGTYSGSPFTGTYSGSYTGQTVLATKDTVSTISLWIRTA